MKVRIYTLGCKVNQFESQAMLGQLLQRGFTQAADGEAADLTIINSCAVTAASESKAMKLIRRIRREQPDTAVLLTGCMAQTIADGMWGMPEEWSTVSLCSHQITFWKETATLPHIETAV